MPQFDFDFWLAEGAKIAGAAASKACSEGYGVPLIERWRKGRVQLCEPGAGRRRRRALLRDVPADGGDGQRNGTAADSAGSVAAPAPARSRIDVFPVKDKRATNMFAAAENTVVDARWVPVPHYSIVPLAFTPLPPPHCLCPADLCPTGL